MRMKCEKCIYMVMESLLGFLKYAILVQILSQNTAQGIYRLLSIKQTCGHLAVLKQI